MIYGTTSGFCLIELYLIENLIVYNQQRSNQHDKQPASSNQHQATSIKATSIKQPTSKKPASSNQHQATSNKATRMTNNQQPPSSNQQPV
jgi:hypothetical protein